MDKHVIVVIKVNPLNPNESLSRIETDELTYKEMLIAMQLMGMAIKTMSECCMKALGMTIPEQKLQLKVDDHGGLKEPR